MKNVQGYIDNHLNPTKINIIDLRKENFAKPLSFPEILAERQIKDDNNYTLSISNTARKLSKYEVFSGSHFPVFSPNPGKYGPEKNSVFEHFSRSERMIILNYIWKGSQILVLQTMIGGHPFSTYANFSEKLTFLTPWYAHVRVRIRG